jgi:predicted Zn-dependent protease
VRFLATIALVAAGAVPAAAAEAPTLTEILAAELTRNFDTLREKASVKPYFIAYSVSDQEETVVSASLGALAASQATHVRLFDASVRVGTPKFDNSHQIGDDRARLVAGGTLVLDDRPAAIRRQLWRVTDAAYRQASQRYTNLLTDAKVKRDRPDAPDDFSPAPAVRYDQVPPARSVPLAEWQKRARKWSRAFAAYPGVTRSSVVISYSREVRYLVTSEGTRLRQGRAVVRIVVSARGRAADGIDLATGRTFEMEDPASLPKDSVIGDAIEQAGQELEALRTAPAAEPYVGPAILSGHAAAVFFHEIFGHRIEGHRQKDESEGQTFTRALGTKILPEFLSVRFDPTLKGAFGSYVYDDEGVEARPVTAVENGVLKSFLVSRNPIEGFPNSNGHGRKQVANDVVSRQSNLVVESSRAVSEEKLKEMLVAEIRRQNKEYGLYFKQVTGGFTHTQRRGLQAFTVIPLVVYRVYANGRPDQLVRGVDIVGTPLASFARILATSDRPDVFNGYCGAESGNVPVSASSPALLVSEIEVQKKAASEQRGPLLPRPPLPGEELR